MTYYSKRPTKQRAEMFDFMERHKVRGSVSGKQLGSYIQEKGLGLESRGEQDSFNVIDKRGTEILRAGLSKKNRVRMWYVP